MELEPINTSTILRTTDPVPTTDLNVPGWVVTETMEISFGDYTGRPDVEHVQLAREMLSYFFDQGWFIVAVISAASSGKWETITKSVSDETRTKVSSGETTTSSDGKATSQSGETASSTANNFYSSSYNISSDGSGGGSGDSRGNSDANSSGVTRTEGSSESKENENKKESGKETDTAKENITKTDAEAYWSSWQKVRLQRKRISPTKVLESMVGELVESRNKGEKAVAERYTAVISLYSTMLGKTENELNSFNEEVSSFKSLMSGVMDTLKGSLSGLLGEGAEETVNEAAEYQRRTINEKFDALVSSEKGRLISAGLFNSTQWTMIAAGIERERGVALLAVSDKIIGWKRDLASAAAGIAGPLEQAARAMWEAGKDGVVTPTTMRNEVLKWMLDYAERHNTERAKVEDIAQLPKILDGIAGGYAEK